MPAADEVHHLQRVQGPEGTLFRTIAEQGHYGGRTKPTNTRQGVYAASASGILLASVNTNDPAKMRAMLEKALSRWEELPKEKRAPQEWPKGERVRWEDLCPSDGLVLRVHTRDLPREKTPEDWRAQAWNRDFAWFRKDEMLSLLPEAKPGAQLDIPQPLLVRLARLHLLDFVRGQTWLLEEKNVEKAELRATVERVEGETVQFRLEGTVRTSAEGTWPVRGFADMERPGKQTRGYEGKLLGRARFDRAKERFQAFELVAVGRRWGGTQYNGRGDDLAEAPMGHVFTLAGSGERVPPAFVWAYGWR